MPGFHIKSLCSSVGMCLPVDWSELHRCPWNAAEGDVSCLRHLFEGGALSESRFIAGPVIEVSGSTFFLSVYLLRRTRN